MTKATGGFAFPQSITATQDGGVQMSDQYAGSEGMTLRDYAAIKFIAAMIGTAQLPAMTGLGDAEPEIAAAGLKMADAFIAARDE